MMSCSCRSWACGSCTSRDRVGHPDLAIKEGKHQHKSRSRRDRE
jgi:hypothetical protein